MPNKPPEIPDTVCTTGSHNLRSALRRRRESGDGWLGNYHPFAVAIFIILQKYYRDSVIVNQSGVTDCELFEFVSNILLTYIWCWRDKAGHIALYWDGSAAPPALGLWRRNQAVPATGPLNNITTLHWSLRPQMKEMKTDSAMSTNGWLKAYKWNL